MGELWEAPAINWAAVILVGIGASFVVWITIYSYFDRRAERFMEKWVRDFGVAETTGEFMIVNSHKKRGGRQWLSGFWNIMHRSKGKARVRGSRHSSSGSLDATSSALRGLVIPPTRSTRSSIERNSNS